MNQIESMADNLLLFLRNRKRDGKSWSKPAMRSQRPDHVRTLHSAVLRCLRMGNVQESGGYLAITPAGQRYLKDRGHG